MDRRKFLSSLIGGVAATAAVRTFPFRVYSFPAKIAAPASTIMSGHFIAGDRDPVEVAVYRSPIGAGTDFRDYVLIEVLSIEEARRKYNYKIKEWISTEPSLFRGPTEFDVLV